jgi:isoleucyl-tRNA synthetase
LELWASNGVEQRSLQGEGPPPDDLPDGEPPAYVFFDGPPFATGLPHYGHLLAGTIKDIIPRYWAMRGRRVERRFGWDCHGLPIENLVEDQLDLHGTGAIEAYGIERFNGACRAGVLRFTREWEVTVRRMGRWVDFVRDYKTMDASFMESVWWVFHKLWTDGRIYEGYRVQPVSPLLGTPLSNFEVALGPQERDPVTRKDGHKRRQDPAVTVRFALEDEDASVWAWTTTPWTLPSNLALAVHPDFDYVKVRVDATGEVAYVEPSRLADYQARGRIGATTELARVPGRALVGRPYRPLFPYFEHVRTRDDGSRWAFRVVAAEYVTRDSGTGVVHQAPAHGEDDYATGQREGLPMIRPMNLNGVFDHRVTDFAGMFAKDADPHIVRALKDKGALVDQDVIVHAYPHCYRTEAPLLYMALSTWFMAVEPLRERLVELNREIRWVPDHVGSGRFGNWLEAARDWNLARSRYWGTPLPIWRCDEDPSELVCIGAVAELEQRAGLAPGSITDLHRESIDAITFPSERTPGGTMRRVPEVFDCWFESGSMPYAQNHYPFDAATRAYVEDNLPADFIAEGLDQTRGWFYTLHVLAAALFDRPAFRNVIVNGLVLAEDGKKMSKRLKNYPEPGAVLEGYGADALRAYLIHSAVVRAEPMRFSEQGVRDTVRLAILPLWNAYNFLVTYARADGWTPTAADLRRAPEAEADRWIVSRVQWFVGELRAEFDAYALSKLMPHYLELMDDLNNWYIRRGRRRFWRGARDAGAADKHAAFATLTRVVVTVAHAMAPVLPFFSEWLYQRLVVDAGLAGGAGEDSVHLRPFPAVDAALRDQQLEQDVAAVREAVGLAMAVRERERLGVRRPLRRVTIAARDPQLRAALNHFEADILGELNVKELELLEDDAGLVELAAKANFKTLGRRLGKAMKAAAEQIATLAPTQLAALAEGGSIALTLTGEHAGEVIELTGEDVLVVRTPLAGLASEASPRMTVSLHTALDDELRHEGLARELINRVQNLRKQADLAVSDRIALEVACGPELARAAAQPALRELVAAETLALDVRVVAHDPGEPASSSHHELRDEVDGEPLRLRLERREGPE